MVCKIFEILDENQIKILSKKDYNMVKITFYHYCHRVINSFNETVYKTVTDDDLNETKIKERNKDYIEPHGLMLKFRNKYFELKNFLDEEYWSLKQEYYGFNYEQEMQSIFQKHFSEKNLLDYLGIIPFTPSVMINISPNWNEKTSIGRKIWCLKEIINNYMKEQWYDKWEYVIENGSDGTHIHAHIVAHMNPARLKSVESHLRKGNHSQQLKKYTKGVKGIQGCIKGNSIQKTFLRNELLVKDKLDYLHEDRKPEGHKNKSIIDGGYVCGCL
jgi:hypothetical protein